VNLENYFPVLLFLLVGLGVGVAPQVLGHLLGPNKPDAAKLSPFECGFEAFEDARMKFDVRYYLVAILFILFDLETAFFFPWGVSMRELGWQGYVTMMVFIAESVFGISGRKVPLIGNKPCLLKAYLTKASSPLPLIR